MPDVRFDLGVHELQQLMVELMRRQATADKATVCTQAQVVSVADATRGSIGLLGKLLPKLAAHPKLSEL